MARVTPLPPHERLLWQGHPSWADHALLFLFMAAAFLRAALAFQAGEWLTAFLYAIAIGVFFGIAAIFHYSAYYQISSQRVRIASGLWMPRARDILLEEIQSITVKRELLNRWLNLGSLEITPREGREGMKDSLILKGVPDPDRIKQQVDRFLRWPHPQALV